MDDQKAAVPCPLPKDMGPWPTARGMAFIIPLHDENYVAVRTLGPSLNQTQHIRKGPAEHAARAMRTIYIAGKGTKTFQTKILDFWETA